MHPADIKATVTKAGQTYSSLAGELHCSVSAISLVVQGSMTSARIARRISELAQLPVASLWPGRYPQLEQEQKLRAARAVQKRSSAKLARV